MRGFLRFVRESSEDRVKFTAYDLLKIVLLIGSRGTVGRRILSRELGIGEGVIRTILSRLKERGYVEMSRDGYRLTEKGKNVYLKLKENLRIIDAIKLKSMRIWKTYSGVLIRGRANRVLNGVEQRDAAIKGGADGAITVKCSEDKLSMPGLEEYDEYWELLDEVKSIFKPDNGDVIIIVGGKTRRAVRIGVINAALTLL